MPRPMRGGNEKSKDFKGSMIKIIKSLKPWYTGIIVSLVLTYLLLDVVLYINVIFVFDGIKK